MKLGHVPVEESRHRSLRTDDSGYAEIVSCGRTPGYVDNLRRVCEESPSQISGVRAQGLVEFDRLQSRDGHALPVYRIKAADRVSKNEISFWKPIHGFVAVSHTGRETSPLTLIDRLRLGNDVIDVGGRQSLCELNECGEFGWHLSAITIQADSPSVSLLSYDDSTSPGFGCGRD